MVEEFKSALSQREVPMVEAETVARIRGLRAAGWGAKRIARELKMRRNTVRRYLKGGESAEVQVRPGARQLDDGERRRAEQLFAGEAAGNAVVVGELLMAQGVAASMRTCRFSKLENIPTPEGALGDEHSRRRPRASSSGLKRLGHRRRVR